MAWTQVQEVEGPNSAPSTSLTLTLGATPTNNNLLVFVAFMADGTGASIAGFTSAVRQVNTNGGGTATIEVFYRVASGDTAAQTLNTTNANRMVGKFIEYSGNATTGVLDVTAVGTDGSGSGGYTGLPSDPTWKNDLAVMAFGWVANGAAVINTVLEGHGGENQIGVQVDWGAGVVPHMRAYEHFGTGGEEQMWDGVFYGNGSTGASCVAMFKPVNAVANTALASGAGTGTFVQAGGTTAGAVASISKSFAGAPASGNIMVGHYTATSSGAVDTVTPPTGWTQWGSYEHFTDGSGSGKYLHSSIWSKIVSGDGAGPYTFTPSAIPDSQCLIVSEFGTVVSRDLVPVFHSHGSSNASITFKYGTRRTAVTVGDEIVLMYLAAKGGMGAGAANPDNGFIKAADTASLNPTTGSLWYKMTNVPGPMSIQVDSGINNSDRSTACIHAMGVALGDHWAWAEGSDAVDSWFLE